MNCPNCWIHSHVDHAPVEVIESLYHAVNGNSCKEVSLQCWCSLASDTSIFSVGSLWTVGVWMDMEGSSMKRELWLISWINSKQTMHCCCQGVVYVRVVEGFILVGLAVSPSWGKDIYSQVFCQKDIYLQSRPSLLGNRISHNAIPAKAHSVVWWVTRKYYDFQGHRSKKGSQFATTSLYKRYKAITMGHLPIRQVNSLMIS